jgi:hypothetical protein
MRRKRQRAIMKQELGQSVDHFKRAATLAAQETSATVGPKFSAAKEAARDKVQPVATKAIDTASSGWESAVATLAPLVTAAAESARQAGHKTAKVSKRTAKANKKNAQKLEKRANQLLGRQQTGRRTGRLLGIGVAGLALGAGAAYVLRRRAAKQWDEYDPTRPISSAQEVGGADDAAFEPIEPVNTTETGQNIKS